ncbi:hypothetical protein LXL04_020104 [Taraxacum kok-saghyz]
MKRLSKDKQKAQNKGVYWINRQMNRKHKTKGEILHFSLCLLAPLRFTVFLGQHNIYLNQQKKVFLLKTVLRFAGPSLTGLLRLHLTIPENAGAQSTSRSPPGQKPKLHDPNPEAPTRVRPPAPIRPSDPRETFKNDVVLTSSHPNNIALEGLWINCPQAALGTSQSRSSLHFNFHQEMTTDILSS